MHGKSRVYISSLPGIGLGALRFVNYGHDVDALWKCGGYGLISWEVRDQAIREFDLQLENSFTFSYFKDGEREVGVICSSPVDVNVYADHERLYCPSRLKNLGYWL